MLSRLNSSSGDDTKGGEIGSGDTIDQMVLPNEKTSKLHLYFLCACVLAHSGIQESTTHVFKGASEPRMFLILKEHEAKVAEYQLFLLIYENVLWLDVTMDKSLSMQSGNPRNDWPNCS